MTIPVSSQEPSDPSAALERFFAAEWEWTLEQNPTWASTLGDRRWNDRWEDVTLENLARQHAHRQEALKHLASISRDALPAAEQVSYDIFRYQYDMEAEGFPFEQHLIRTNTYSGIQTAVRIADIAPFETEKDFADYVTRLRTFPAFMDQNIALMRRGISENVLLPKVIMRRIAAQAARLATGPVEESGFFKPFRRVAAAGAPAPGEETAAADEPGKRTAASSDREFGAPGAAPFERLREAARRAIADQVQPAYAKLHRCIEHEYLPAAYDQVGAWQNRDGAAAYRWLVRSYTTTDLSPREIHELGLQEVARVRAAMESIKAATGFTGTLAEFFTFLRTDPRFFHASGDALLAAYRATAKRVDPELVKVFRTFPRLPYGVVPVPEAIAPDMTTAYAEYGAADGSRPAYYFVNLYKPETRPTWEMMALTLHEAVPGHCFQGSLAQEATSLPEFRRHAGFTAYVEGWALYAESLGDEMGLYDDPYARFGQLTYEMWRAVRLVIDTGIHAMRWERDRAIRYFMDNAAKTELDVTNEVDRYISWPGQALAYKVGELKIQELRRTAQRTLGERFDLREFHDVLLLEGAMPLAVLERRVLAWVERKRSDSFPVP